MNIRYLKHFCMLASLLAMTFSGFAATFPLPKDGTNIVGQVQSTLSEPGDTLHSIAQRYDIGYYQLVEANPTVNPNKIPKGTFIIVPTQYVLPDAPRQGIVINLAELRLYYYPAGKDEVVTYPVGIGRQGWETPIGVTSIIRKRPNPTWVVPASIRKWREEQGGTLPKEVPPGPDNPLGDYAMNLGWTAYLMHGTNEPSGVGMRSSSGCIRLYPADIDALFHAVNVGTRVQTVDQPVKVGFLDNKVFLEAHLPLQEDQTQYFRENAGTLLVQIVNDDVSPTHKKYDVNWNLAEQVAADHPGIPIVIGHVAENNPTA